MRTNIVIDDDVMSRAMVLSGIKTKKEVVEQAMREFVARLSRKDLRDLRGGIQFNDDYDYKALREGR